MINSSSSRFSSICFSVHSLIVSHDDGFFIFWIVFIFLVYMCYVFLIFMLHVFIYDVFICGTLRWVSLLAVVALLSADLAKWFSDSIFRFVR